jgi:hypothetical protein
LHSAASHASRFLPASLTRCLWAATSTNNDIDALMSDAVRDRRSIRISMLFPFWVFAFSLLRWLSFLHFLFLLQALHPLRESLRWRPGASREVHRVPTPLKQCNLQPRCRTNTKRRRRRLPHKNFRSWTPYVGCRYQLFSVCTQFLRFSLIFLLFFLHPSTIRLSHYVYKPLSTLSAQVVFSNAVSCTALYLFHFCLLSIFVSFQFITPVWIWRHTTACGAMPVRTRCAFSFALSLRWLAFR